MNPFRAVLEKLVSSIRYSSSAVTFKQDCDEGINQSLTSLAEIVEGMKKVPYCIEDKGAVRDCQVYNQAISDIAKMIRGGGG